MIKTKNTLKRVEIISMYVVLFLFTGPEMGFNWVNTVRELTIYPQPYSIVNTVRELTIYPQPYSIVNTVRELTIYPQPYSIVNTVR
jgi:Mlc titration factor MtfA (ptsG expression regulator)